MARAKGSGPTPSSWKKGQSGNPAAGRRIEELHKFRLLLKDALDPSAVAEMLVDLMAHDDAKVRLRALEMYLDRMYGKPKQEQDVNVSTADAIKVVYRMPDNGRGGGQDGNV